MAGKQKKRCQKRCLAVGISEEKVYELAINYFDKTNEELGIKPEESENKKSNINSEKKESEFGSIFDSDDNKTIKDKKEEIEQISLFNSVAQEEKNVCQKRNKRFYEKDAQKYENA